MLNSSGEIYPIEFTGSIPYQLPIGGEHIWGVGENPQQPSSTIFVAEKEFIINYMRGSNSTRLIGGSVDSLGNFTYGAPVVINASTNPSNITAAIDETTYDQAAVRGLSLVYTSTGTSARAFLHLVMTYN